LRVPAVFIRNNRVGAALVVLAARNVAAQHRRAASVSRRPQRKTHELAGGVCQRGSRDGAQYRIEGDEAWSAVRAVRHFDGIIVVYKKAEHPMAHEGERARTCPGGPSVHSLNGRNWVLRECRIRPRGGCARRRQSVIGICG
jgi:hypothetical protein